MKKHYSLIEIMVAMGIFALMMTLLMNFFGQATDVMTRETSRAEKLYEGGVFGVVLNKDLNNITVNGIASPNGYPLEYSKTGNTFLRFFSATYDNDGDDSNILGVSYVYDPTSYTISRFVDKATASGGTFDQTGWATLEADTTKGSIIIEGVEDFEVFICTDFATMEDAITGVPTVNGITTPTSGTLSVEPDCINIRLTLNDHKTLGTGTAIENQLVQNRRIVNFRVMMAYQ
jgi:hypothetical protein